MRADLGLLSMLIFLVSSVWFLISLFQLLIKKWRPRAKRHLLISGPLLVLTLAVGIYGITTEYKDYGLTSNEGLAEAKAAYELEQQAQKDTRKAQRQQAEKAERQQAEAATNAVAAAELKEKCADKSMAFTMSTELVRRQLKAPSTAEFPSFGDDFVYVSTKPGCAFRVLAWVEAQNAFGAQLRTNYAITLAYLPGDNRWHLIDLDMK